MRQIRSGLGASVMLALLVSSCGPGESPPEAVPVSTHSPADPAAQAESPAQMPEDSRVVATGQIALGGNGQIEVESTPASGMFIGLGLFDVQLCGDGRDAICMSACAEPCLAPGYPVGCGPCPGRGTWAGGVITANLTVVNTTSTGTYGECSLQDKTVCTTSIPSLCRPSTVYGYSSGNYCNGQPITYYGTLGSMSPEDTIPFGIMTGYCEDGITPCNASQSADYYGLNQACGGAGSCSDNGLPCSPGMDLFYGSFDDDKSYCLNPLTATCLPPLVPKISYGVCQSGCGTCTPGRPLNCAAFVYTGANSNASPGDLKCTGAPYSLANPNSGFNTIIIGTVPLAGSTPFQVQINAGDSSYCVHTFQIQDDPYGDVFGMGCTATCGDGVVAMMNGEACEPNRDPSDAAPPYRDMGCDDVNPVCNSCMFCTPAGWPCGNGTIDVGEICDDGFMNGISGFCNWTCDGITP